MPVSVRPNNKATRIAYDLIGKPVNIAQQKSKRQKEIDRKMQYEYTSRLR